MATWQPVLNKQPPPQSWCELFTLLIWCGIQNNKSENRLPPLYVYELCRANPVMYCLCLFSTLWYVHNWKLSVGYSRLTSLRKLMAHVLPRFEVLLSSVPMLSLKFPHRKTGRSHWRSSQPGVLGPAFNDAKTSKENATHAVSLFSSNIIFSAGTVIKCVYLSKISGVSQTHRTRDGLKPWTRHLKLSAKMIPCRIWW